MSWYTKRYHADPAWRREQIAAARAREQARKEADPEGFRAYRREVTRRWRDVCSRSLPYLVAELDREVIGYAYASPYRARSAYRFTVEDSVYLERGVYGKGIGRALLSELIRRCERLGFAQMIAVIGDSENRASIGLHGALGFAHAGLLSSVGFKHGRWVDSVIMQRALTVSST